MLYESGIRNRRTEWVLETTYGSTPTDPAWGLFSDRMIAINAEATPKFAPDYIIGSPDPAAIERGPETHAITVGWRLQRWPVDGGGAAQDPLGYAIVRTADDDLDRITIVDRESRASGGAAGGGLRLYTVAVGAVARQVTVTLNPDTGEPIPVEAQYAVEKIRSYRIDQPAASTTLTVVSSNAADTTQTLTVEDDDAATSEGIALNGTTPVVSSSSFSSIDSISLDAETVGDVTITDGTYTLCVIRGSANYQGIEGDLGVPPLGSGSHGAAIGTAFEKFIDDSITRGGSAIADAMLSAEITISNVVEETSKAGSARQVITVGQRTSQIMATLAGEAESHDAWEDSLRQVESDVVWTATGGTFTFTGATLSKPGARSIAPDLTFLQVANEFLAKGVVLA